MHKDWIDEKSTINKGVDYDYDDLSILMNVGNPLIHDKNKDKTDISKRVFHQLREVDSRFTPPARTALVDYKAGSEISVEQAKDTLSLPNS
jgi:hypothetical protein